MNPCSAVWSELAKLCRPLLYPTRTVKHIPDFLSTSFYAWCFLLPIMVKNKITHAYRIEMIKIVHLTSTLWVNPILIYIHTFLHTDDAQADTCLPSPRVPVHIQFTTFHMAHSYLLVLNSEQIVPHTIIMSVTSLMTLWKGVFEVDQKEVIGLCIWWGYVWYATNHPCMDKNSFQVHYPIRLISAGGIITQYCITGHVCITPTIMFNFLMELVSGCSCYD